MKRSTFFAMALISVQATAAAASCLPPEAGKPMKAPSQSLVLAALQTNPPTIQVGAPFMVDLFVCGASGAGIDRLAVDATMPAHRHGMNYKPEISDLGAGRFQAKGLLFHMPGRWEFAVTVLAGGASTRLTLDVDVK